MQKKVNPLSADDIEKIRRESRQDREAIDKVVRKMQTLTADDLRIRID